MEQIIRHYDNPLVGNFINKNTQRLIVKKYQLPPLRRNIEAYVIGCDVCLALEIVKPKLYGNYQCLSISIHKQKELSIGFVTSLSVSTNQKDEIYDSILVIVNKLTKMVQYKPVKLTNNIPGLAEIIFNMVVRQHDFSKLIVSN